ncbi:Aldehyde dehydrogenase [Escovopsis weberi]|uniref:aldehyde dehydrogenase (NAD(+)) n=1 Tax=Escovopsis weberi TaxID=150374 RepID=A0A0M8MZJ0_ESCWE|nr:Aldehyde dehydrogenase [Escovopsis weberi]
MSKLVAQLEAPNGLKFSLPTGLFINNEFVASSSGSKIVSISPINGEEIVSVEAASEADVDAAVQAANAAFDDESAWRQVSGAARSALLHRLADLIEEHRHTLATIETWDNGKAYTAAYGFDVGLVIKTFRYYAGYADKIHGQTIPTNSGKLVYTLRQPVGVCASVIPWNFPLCMAGFKLGPALATGNVVVMKPAEQTPLSILYVADLIRQAGFPPGVVNIINGYGSVAGRSLAEHPGVRKIGFTGSTLIGREIMKAGSLNLKNLTLETGGKSALIVFPDADMTLAAQRAFFGSFTNQGQVCAATSRILVHESIKDQFLDAFIAFINATSVVGDPFEQTTTQGPQVSDVQYDKILKYIEGAQQQGAKLKLGGTSAQAGLTNGKGFFIHPTVLTDVTKDMTIFQEEVFGPVVTITTFSTDKEAVALANSSEYGLSAAVFTRDIGRAHRAASSLHAGTVWINSVLELEVEVPFGGMKQSGIGRELGEAGLHDYLETKSIHVNIHA